MKNIIELAELQVKHDVVKRSIEPIKLRLDQDYSVEAWSVPSDRMICYKTILTLEMQTWSKLNSPEYIGGKIHKMHKHALLDKIYSHQRFLTYSLASAINAENWGEANNFCNELLASCVEIG